MTQRHIDHYTRVAGTVEQRRQAIAQLAKELGKQREQAQEADKQEQADARRDHNY